MENLYKGDKLIFKMLFDGIIIGIFAGLLSVFYRWIINRAFHLRQYIMESQNLVYILFFAFCLVLFSFAISQLLKYAPLSGGSGIPQIRGEVIGRFDMDAKRTLISKVVGGLMGGFAGLSLGREGPSIQMGGACAKLIAKIFKKNPNETKYMVTAGASAGLAAAFNAPISGAIFAMEEIHKSFSKYVLIPCIIASVIANYVSFTILGQEKAFSFIIKKNLPLRYFAILLILGIVTGLAGVLFNVSIKYSQKFYQKIKAPLFVKILGLMMLSLFISLTFFEITGGGHALMEDLAKVRMGIFALFLIFIFKLIFTALSYGSGVQGGIFLPVLVLGGVCGAFIYQLFVGYFEIEIYYVNFIILGMAGILTSVVRAPILSIILVTEMTGSFTHLIGLTIVAIVSYYVAEILHNAPIYDYLFENLNLKFTRKIVEEHDYAIYEYTISALNPCINQTLNDIQWPRHLLIMSIHRDGREFVPKANDIIEIGDRILVLAKAEDLQEIDEFFKVEQTT